MPINNYPATPLANLPMQPNYAIGSYGRAFIQPGGLTTSTECELEVTGYEINIDSDLKTFDNNAYGRWKQGGNVDANGTLKMHWDLSYFPTSGTVTSGPNLKDGAIAGVQLQVDGLTGTTNSYRLLIILDQIKTTAEFTGTLDFECTWKLQSGQILYPGQTGAIP